MSDLIIKLTKLHYWNPNSPTYLNELHTWFVNHLLLIYNTKLHLNITLSIWFHGFKLKCLNNTCLGFFENKQQNHLVSSQKQLKSCGFIGQKGHTLVLTPNIFNFYCIATNWFFPITWMYNVCLTRIWINTSLVSKVQSVYETRQFCVYMLSYNLSALSKFSRTSPMQVWLFFWEHKTFLFKNLSILKYPKGKTWYRHSHAQ